jgi:hypothetical protein
VAWYPAVVVLISLTVVPVLAWRLSTFACKALPNRVLVVIFTCIGTLALSIPFFSLANECHSSFKLNQRIKGQLNKEEIGTLVANDFICPTFYKYQSSGQEKCILSLGGEIYGGGKCP